jgi:class 3 adenylate cyclase
MTFAMTLDLLLTDGEEPGFAVSVGHGIGHIFPSLSNKLQQKILKYLQTNWKFAKGFGPGLSYSFKYLYKDAQEQISNLIARNASLQKYLEVSNDSNIGALSEIILKYDDFPLPSSITCKISTELHPWNVGTNDEAEISFSGQRFNYCIGFIDMMNSTKNASGLAGTEISKYYSTFLNAMATIINNYGAKIIKNAGDALIYYFPKTSDIHNKVAFKDVLVLTMMASYRSINSKMRCERLPSINYRISADYGEMQLAKSSSTQSQVLFGTAINVCTKMNSKAPANKMVIGDDLYRIVKGIDGYNFTPIGEFPTNLNHNNDYYIYLVGSKQQENILNPFKRKSSIE